MRRAASTVALALAAFAIGCGGGEESDEDQVRSTLETFASANLNGDFGDACAQLTPSSQEQIAEAGAQLGGKGCAGTLKAAVGRLEEADLKKEFEDIEITAIKVNTRDLTATAKVNGEEVRLAETSDGWRIQNAAE